MADEKIVTSIVANSDFSNLIADLQRVTSSLHNLQQEFAGGNRALAGQIAATNAMFAETMRKTGQYSTHFVSLTSDVEKFGKSLDGGRLKLADYFRVYQDHVRTSGGLIRDLAKQQVQLQNAVLQPLGKNAQGLMQYNVHIPRGLDVTKNKTALLKQELQIMNKVIQDGGVQLINWGKNTQWAGRQLTVGLTLPLVAFGKAAADAFRVADQELTRLTKVYGDVAGTSAQELAKVRKDVAATAKELSSAMGVNFAETISLAADIAATGKTGNELLSSVKETTRLAVLGEVDRQEAMKATLAIQSAFKSNTDELAQSINFLNAVENQTSTTLNDLVEAIPKAGPVIKGLGGNVQDLALYLTAMREGGVNASEGANALKSALASLINPTDVAVKKFQGFGIDLLGIVRKNAGSTTDTLFALQAALDKLDPLSKQQAIEQLFGKFQFSRLNALFENLGRQGSQTLQVLDLMKASAGELEAVAGRELTAVTESAAGRFKRAMESLKADLAGIGDQFLNIATKLINVLDKILQFGQKLPDPIKKILAFGGAFTAIIGPVIMLTGVLANFFGYIIKGLGHFKALFKGAEGFKLLTPEIMAAQHASSLLGDEFYNDAKAAETLRLAIRKLSEDLVLLQKNASGATAATAGLGQIVATPAGTPISVVGGTSLLRQADPTHPLIGGQGRAAAHLNPRDPNNPATMFGLTFQPEPLNRVIGRTPQILMTERLPGFEGLTEVGGRSTGVVAGEHARYAALMATLGLQSKAEIEELKKTIRFGGQVSSDFIATFDDILPITTDLSNNAAAQSAAIVAQLRAGTITVEQAKARIIAINAQLEAMMGEAIIAYGAGRGRTIDLTKTPLIDQPIVDVSGKPNVRGMFRQGIFRDVMTAVGRATRTRTYGGPYSIETTMPTLPPGYTMSPSGLIIPGRNKGGEIFYNNGDQVPGPNVNADVVPAMLTPGEFVIRRDIAQQDPDGMRALNEGRAIVVPFNANSGGMVPGVQYRNGGNWIVQAFAARSRMIGGLRTPNLRPGSTSGPSTIGAAEQGVGVSFGQIYKRTSKIYSDPTFMAYGISPTTKGEVLVHAMTPGYLRRTSGLEAAGSSVAIPSSQLKDFGITSTSRAPFLQALPSQFAKNTQKFNDALKSGALAADFRPVVGSDMISLLLFLKDQGVPPAQAIAIANEAAKNLNDRVLGHRGKITEALFGRFLNDASVKALLSAFRIKRNRGGKIPGYILGGITRKWGKVYGGDELSNTDPLHGPLQIGKFVSPKNTRTGRSGQKVFYTRPGSTSLTDAFLTGSLEDRGRYVTQEYMLGNYDVLRIPGAIEAMKAWGRKATGTFYRGINFRKFSAGPKPLPDWLEAEIKAAQASGDFSGLIGKEFIMRRSSWTSNPNIANEFGDFRIVADVKNRRVTPSSEMFPGIKFVPKSAQKKSKAKKLEAARSEEESIFGGKFRIVAADKDGIRVETVAGPMGGNRRFGGPVNAGTPYVVGENGPELFVPKSSGGIVPNYGYARGVQNRIAGGPILRLLAMLGIPMAGQAVGSRVGGAAGSAISTGSYMASMFMMPGMMPGRSFITPGQRLGMAGPLLEGEKQIGGMRKSIFAGGRYASGINEMASSGTKLTSVFGKLLAGITRFNVALTVAVGTVAFAIKKIKEHQRTQELSAAQFGMTAEQAEKAGLKYKNYSSKVRDAVEAQKLIIAQNKLDYQSMASAGTPFDLTITEYKKLKKEVKETMQTQIDMFNAIKNQDVSRVATQLKVQFIAAGMSVEDANEKIYTLLQLSDKASMTFSAMGSKSFRDITDAQKAATAAVEAFNYAVKFENTRDQAMALNTALTAIDNSITDIYKKAELAAKKKQQDFNETKALQNAEKQVLEEINKKAANQLPIRQELYQYLIKTDPVLGQMVNKQDTMVSLWQKMKIAAMGYSGLLSGMNAKQTAVFYNFTTSLADAIEQQNRSVGGLLEKQYVRLGELERKYKDLSTAARGQSVRQQINTRDAIKAIDEEIKKINEAADARKKALQEEAEDQDINIEIQKKRLDYQQKLAMGDMGGAAQSQLDLQQLVNRQQRTLTERAIEERRLADIAPLEKQKQILQDAQQNLADKAALAADNLEKVGKELDKQKNAINKANSAILDYRLKVITGAKGQERAAATAIQALKDAGVAVKEFKDTVDVSTPFGNVVQKKLTPKEILDNIIQKYDGTMSIETILAQKDIIITGTTVTLNGQKINLTGVGTKENPYDAGKASDIKVRTPAGRGTVMAPISDARLRDPSNTLLKQLGEAVKAKGYTSGDYFTLTDSKGNPYTFKLNKEGKAEKAALGKYIPEYAKGTTSGPVSGPGTGTSDSILARLSNGEFVTKASSVSSIGVGNMHLVNSMGAEGLIRAAQNIIQGKAGGGYIAGFKEGGISGARTHITNWNKEKIPIMPRGIAKPGTEYAIAPEKNYPIDHIKSPMGSIQRFIDIARSQIGSGHNYKIVDKEGTEWDVDANKYTTYVNDLYKLGSDVLYWCGAFIAWASANSGVKISDRMFSAFQSSQEYKKRGMFNDLSKIENLKNVKPGDIAWFDLAKAQTPGIPDHASIVTGKTRDGIRAIGQYGTGKVVERNWNFKELFGSVSPEGFAKGGLIKGYPMGGLIPYSKNGGMPNPFAMGMEWFGETLRKSVNSVTKFALGFDQAKPFGKQSGMEKLAMAMMLIPGGGAATGATKSAISSTKASTTIMRNLRKAMVESAINAGRTIPDLNMKDSLKMSTSMLLESSDAGAAFRKYWGKAYDILVSSKNPIIDGMNKDDFLKNIVNSTEDATTRWKGTGFSITEGPSKLQIDKPSDFIKAANAAYLQAHGLSTTQPLAMFRAVRAPWNEANYIEGVRMSNPSLTPEEIISSNLAHELGGYWSLSSRMAASYLRNLNITKGGLSGTSYGGLYKADIPIELFPSPVGMGGMVEEYANVFNPATIDSLRSATRIGKGWADDLSSIYRGPQRYLRMLDFYKSALIPSKGKVSPDIVEKIKANLTDREIDLVFGSLLKESSNLGGRSIPLASRFMQATPPIGLDEWIRVIKKAEAALGQPLLIPKIAGGGYINPAYFSNMSMPSYYTGAKYVYDDTIAQLHKGEMVVPSAMNPNNPFATNTSEGGIKINNNLTVNAAPGMDTDELVNKVFVKVEQATSLALAKSGRTRRL